MVNQINLSMIKERIKKWLDKTDPEGLTNADGCFMAMFALVFVIVVTTILVFCT